LRHRQDASSFKEKEKLLRKVQMDRGREYKARRRSCRNATPSPNGLHANAVLAPQQISLCSAGQRHARPVRTVSRSSAWRRKVASTDFQEELYLVRDNISQQRERTWESFPKMIHLQKRNII
jgi:hypothetical protein